MNERTKDESGGSKVASARPRTPRMPPAGAVDEALWAFERLWDAVPRGERSRLAEDRNDVRRVLTAVLGFLREAETRNERRDEEDPVDEPSPEILQAARAIADVLLTLDPDGRCRVLDLLDLRFCAECGAYFETQEEAEAHDDECPALDDGDDEEDEDDEDHRHEDGGRAGWAREGAEESDTDDHHEDGYEDEAAAGPEHEQHGGE